MATMSKYCCAYPASRLRAYDGWNEKVPPLQATLDSETGEKGETLDYYFLHDTYVVTASVWADERVAFDALSDAWRRFCAEQLDFAVPNDGDAPDEPESGNEDQHG